jgi:hypothetical protein
VVQENRQIRLQNWARLSSLSVSLQNLYALFDTIPTVPRFTEERIKRLCGEAITAKTQEDLDCVIKELRTALEEHIRLAKESLECSAIALPSLNSGKRRRG